MGLTVTGKILATHLSESTTSRGSESLLKIDQCLVTHSSGALVWSLFETLGLERVRCSLVLSCADEPISCGRPEFSGEHLFLKSAARKFGAFFAKPGSGVPHQIHIERFAIPGKTLLGSGPDVRISGALGMIALQVNCIELAAALAGAPVPFKTPRVWRVFLDGKPPWGCGAHDVALEVLLRLQEKLEPDIVIEFGGPGVSVFSVPQRATIAGAAIGAGAVACVFPSDERTLEFLASQERKHHHQTLKADDDASWDREMMVDLGTLQPLAAVSGSPVRVMPVTELEGAPVHRVFIGSCAGGFASELSLGAALLRHRPIARDTELILSPGSLQSEQQLIDDGSCAVYVDSGARVVEPGYQACPESILPGTFRTSLRTFHPSATPGNSGRNEFSVSLFTAIASAQAGTMSDPRNMDPVCVPEPLPCHITDELLVPPASGEDTMHIERVPGGSVPLQPFLPLEKRMSGLLVTPENMEKANADQSLFLGIQSPFRIEGNQENRALWLRSCNVAAVLAPDFSPESARALAQTGIIPLALDVTALHTGGELELSIDEWPDVTVIRCADQVRLETQLPLNPCDRDILHAGGLLNVLSPFSRHPYMPDISPASKE